MNATSLSHSLLFSAATVASLVAPIAITPSASASQLCFTGDIDTLLDQGFVVCGDKLFNNFAFDPLFNTATETVTIENNELANPVNPGLGVFVFQYEDDLVVSTAQSASFSYDITINDPLVPVADRIEDAQFDGVSIGLDIVGLIGSIEAKKSVSFDGDGGIPIELGAPIPPGVQFLPPGVTKVSVLDTLVFSANSELESISNDFTQIVRSGSTPTPVPEPGTIIGLLALGGLGLATKGKKQQ